MPKLPDRVEVEGLTFDPITTEEALVEIQSVLSRPARRHSYRVVKPYVEFFDPAERDPEIRDAINAADLVLADSVAIQWAASWHAEVRPTFRKFIWSFAIGLRKKGWITSVIPERGAGVRTTHDWLLAASGHGWRVGILGGPEDTTHTEEALAELYPMLQLQKVWSGYFKPHDEARLVTSLKEANLDILFVALGFPKQELFMKKHMSDGIGKILIGEGGTFDFDTMGGRLKHAPAWMRSIGLEWLWRLLLQPHRIGRQLAIPRFMWQVFRSSKSAKSIKPEK